MNETTNTGKQGAMEYNFREIEQKWQLEWINNNAYRVPNQSEKPKYYVLDMFPYPSGAGLHVGHPLGYIASDVVARYKRLKGFNVLHPMGYDAFGLPAEQYAIEHGVHPAVSTAKNIQTFRGQLDKIGFSYDWSREVNTSDPHYYKWTQWIFLQLFKSWYNRRSAKTEPIDTLIKIFEAEGNSNHPIPNSQFQIPGLPLPPSKLDNLPHSFSFGEGGRRPDEAGGTVSAQSIFTAEAWKSFSEKQQQAILMEYRVAYCGYGEVNWCEALGTVLANDEVVNGVSERGGYPVVKKKLRQWYLRITEYADRLLEGLQRVDFSDAMKEMQTNWIGKSSGAEIDFAIAPPPGLPLTPSQGGGTANAQPRPVEEAAQNTTSSQSEPLSAGHSPLGGAGALLRVYTTRPDTIFGVDFMVVAPEHELVEKITSPEQKAAVEEYIAYVKSRSERERMAEKKISGVFTGAYAVNPFDGRQIPIWISEYVLAGYGTGAIMAVPSGDERDFKFANHFNIPITNILGDAYNGQEANPTKDAVLTNSGFLNGMVMRDAIDVVINKLEEKGIGKRKVNFKMRDAAFSRQRYWGEPFPIKWIDGIAYPLDESELPLELPYVESYGPGAEGEGPLANIESWTAQDLETNTMPGYAGSSWYFLRYMDPLNDAAFCDKDISTYWNQVDLYVGGTEHAVGHLLYSRMWTKALYDLGLITFDEPFKRLLNQGMITGKSFYVDGYMYYPEGSDDVDKRILFFTSHNSERKPLGKKQFLNAFWELDNNNFSDLRVKYAHKYIDAQGRLTKSMWEKYKNEQLDDSKDLSRVYVDWELEDKTENGEPYLSGMVIEKMSKSKFNVENPDDIVEQYGADTFRLYEMFLGPIEMSKPWDTKGIEGVHRFLKKLWRLFFNEEKGESLVTEDKASPAELKVLHRTIKKIEEDIERFSFNTCVSAFMVCVNELTDLKCHKREVLEPLLVLLSPYAPHISEELWHQLGNTSSVLDAAFPVFESSYLVESTKEYPVSINGKLRTTMVLDLSATQDQVQEAVMQNPVVQKWLENKPVKKFIFVKGKMVNVVV